MQLNIIQRLMPLTTSQHFSENIFAMRIGPSPTQPTSVRINAEQREAIEDITGATGISMTALFTAAINAIIEAHKRDGILALPFSIYSKPLEAQARRTPGADRRTDAPGKKPRRREKPHGPHGPQIDQPVRERSA